MPEDEEIPVENNSGSEIGSETENNSGSEIRNNSPQNNGSENDDVAAPNGANDGRAAPDTEAEETPAERTEDVGTTLQETELHPYKWLKRGSRILFYFDQGKFAGVYQGPSRRKRDQRNDIYPCRFVLVATNRPRPFA